MGQNPYRVFPSVDKLASSIRQNAGMRLTAEATSSIARVTISEARRRLDGGAAIESGVIESDFAERLRAVLVPKLIPLINATGIVIHTNLGRSPVSDATSAAMAEAAGAYVALEIDPVGNARGGRMAEVSALMRALTGAEATLIVNNNAAAILLALSAIAAGRSVIVSRGEAVEIGGGFRIPDVLRQSGARLVEVGTTNRTYARDYLDAIDGETAAILKVHPSNFVISGFTAEASIEDLAQSVESTGVPIIDDLGSGALLETARFGMASEPTIRQRLEAGASVITASGDKLLGGPQAGIIAGEKRWIDLIAAHPLARAVRADKSSLAGIAATLRHYAFGEAEERIPIWRMISATPSQLASRAAAISADLGLDGVDARVVETRSAVGGGSLPGQTQPSQAVAFDVVGTEEVARRLRTGSPPVFPRIDAGLLLVDLRAVLPEQDAALTRALLDALRP